MSRIGWLVMPRAAGLLAAAGFVVGALLANNLQAQNGNCNFGGGNRVGGVTIDAQGALSSPDESMRKDIVAAMRTRHNEPRKELNLPVEMRRVSLRRLDEALAAAKEGTAEKVADELRFLAGIQRIQYVLVYPDENDIVLAGPGEGWKVDEGTNIIGVTTGRPVIRLEDLLIALRSAEEARQGGISCSIDPTPEGRRNLEAFLAKQRTFNPAVLVGVKEALGPQEITLKGVPPTSHFARILVSSDFHMKRIAMKLDPSPLKELPSFIDMLKTENSKVTDLMPRWWMACNYLPVGRSADGLGFEIRGRGVKVLTEDEAVDGGAVRGTGKANPVAQKWADLMTEHYDELSLREPAFGELRNIMDLCVVSALIAKEGLLEKAGCQLPTLMGANSPLGVIEYPAPKTVETQTSSLKRGREYIITASGGVDINSWEVADKTEIRPEVAAVHAKAKPAKDLQTVWAN
ncbi:MAG: DUF1598 domain-containing protein [Pirellulaceae bacterium]|nr:DUF1598 domain-containing protein [Pirellulaceae bacterium]